MGEGINPDVEESTEPPLPSARLRAHSESTSPINTSSGDIQTTGPTSTQEESPDGEKHNPVFLNAADQDFDWPSRAKYSHTLDIDKIAQAVDVDVQ